jgi:hypothetical protein
MVAIKKKLGFGCLALLSAPLFDRCADHCHQL